MDFEIIRQSEKFRSGLISFNHFECRNTKGFSNRPKCKQCFETPCFLAYTRRGRIPNLTKDVTGYLPSLPSAQRMQLAELMEESVMTSLGQLKKSYACFTGNDSRTNFFCSVQDAAVSNRVDIHKYAEDKSISVWTPSGRRKVTPEEFMNVIELSGIHFAEALCDVIPAGESTKRCRKSVDRTLRYLDKCISIKKENTSKYENIMLFGAIVGGDCVKERLKSAQETAKRDNIEGRFFVPGFVLEGFDMLGQRWLEILSLTINELPSNKPRILFGNFKPDQIVDAVISGVDVFDSSCVYDTSERGCAAVFEYRCKRGKHANSETHSEADSVSDSQPEFEIDLKDTRFKDDFRPVLLDCGCYTCLNYTRVYVHHLLVTNEMLAQVLLTM
eukprot:gene15812-17407_t